MDKSRIRTMINDHVQCVTVEGQYANPFAARDYGQEIVNAADSVIAAMSDVMLLECALCHGDCYGEYAHAVPGVVEAVNADSYDMLFKIVKDVCPGCRFAGVEDLSSNDRKVIEGRKEKGFRATFMVKIDEEDGSDSPFNYRVITNRFPAETPLEAVAACVVAVVGLYDGT